MRFLSKVRACVGVWTGRCVAVGTLGYRSSRLIQSEPLSLRFLVVRMGIRPIVILI